jgi:tryptophan-rich sensory protein
MDTEPNREDVRDQRMEDFFYQKTVSTISYYPPSWLFGVVWPILYILLISAILVHYRELNSTTAGVYYDLSTIFIFINFMLNKGWFPLFFKKKMYLIAALVIAGMLISGFITLVVVALNEVHNHWVVFALFLIYELWCCFALILNVDFYIKEKKIASEYSV